MIDDELFFATEEDLAAPADGNLSHKWVVIVADDEPNVHDVTELALVGFEFDGKPLHFVHANSGAEAFEAAQQYPEAAVLLLDVVMETEHAGLDVVRLIREQLNNHTVRIVLRTGQPGAAPESQVISRYDINDYKEKTELTANKLYNLMYTCLRAYRDIITIQSSQRGLERIIAASADIFKLQSLEKFTSASLDQLSFIMQINGHDPIQNSPIVIARQENDLMTIIGGTGKYAGLSGTSLQSVFPYIIHNDFTSKQEKSFHYNNNYFTIFEKTGKGSSDKILIIQDYKPKSDLDRQQIDIFSRNIAISFENIELKDAIEDAQREIIYRLGGVVETRSKETANHVRRVAKMSALLGSLAGMSPREATIFEYASPMHDIGKVGIPDAILNKPGKLTPEEWEVMKTHAYLGYDILKGSDHEILQTAAVIALEHHEKWDGSGYPFNKKGHEISIHGRVTAVADVFDALASDRCYKKSWEMDKVLALFQEQSGHHFDPDLVNLLFTHLDQFIDIRNQYKDD